MTDIASHRGGALLWAENSRLAFEQTARLPVEQVEFDVHPSRDGKLVVIHDATLERTTDGKGAVFGSADYVTANKRRMEMIAAVNAALAEVDVLLCASSMDPACRIDNPAEIERTYPRQARTPFNNTGHPALAMMSGLSSSGLPLSVQFVGRYFDEAMLFRVARAWEQASGMDRKHPPIG